jgi:hypothetical protein
MQSNKRAGILPRWLLAKLNLVRRRMQSISCGAPQSKSFGKCSCAAAARETKLSNQADNAAFGDSGLHYRFCAALRLIKSLGPANQLAEQLGYYRNCRRPRSRKRAVLLSLPQFKSFGTAQKIRFSDAQNSGNTDSEVIVSAKAIHKRSAVCN